MLLACAVLGAGAAPGARRADPAARAHAFLEALRARTGAPSISAAVARQGRIVFSDAVGVADLATGEPATRETVYNVGSVSKVMTAIAVLQLVERGAVRLEDPIQKYVPTFPDKGAPITVWNLLTHTSGIRHYRVHDFPGADWEENHRPYASVAEAIGIFANDPLLFRPGAFHFYSSYGVNLLQGVVEAAAGTDFESYLREKVWMPAGMDRTHLDVRGRHVMRRARGYAPSPAGLVPTLDVDASYKYASGGMISTAEDLARLGIALSSGVLMRAETRARMLEPHVPVVRRFREDGPPVTERYRQALMWRLVDRPRGHGFAYHCGTFNGFNACLLDYVADDLVVAMTFNREEGGYKPAEELAALFRASATSKASMR